MIYAYIRVSTDKQTVENQRFEINRFAKQRDFQIDVWVEETVSGTRSAKDRKLGVLLKRIKKGDTLIVSEISRLGRRLMEVMSILNACMLKNVILLTVKEKYELGNNIQSQILAFAFSLSAQIERDLISQRTREGLARRIASGQKLGRPMGGHNSKYKLTGKEEKIKITGEGKQTNHLVNQAFEYIAENYAENLSLAEVAEQLGISGGYLSSLFNQNVHCGFVDYINTVRVDRACCYLEQDYLKTYEIAYKVGFNDEKYFSKVFKKIKGVSPKQYRIGKREGLV